MEVSRGKARRPRVGRKRACESASTKTEKGREAYVPVQRYGGRARGREKEERLRKRWKLLVVRRAGRQSRQVQKTGRAARRGGGGRLVDTKAQGVNSHLY
jgi:hypothetical protein